MHFFEHEHRQENDSSQLSSSQIEDIRKKLESNPYMLDAVQSLASELSIELMENQYGISFH